MKDEIKRIHEYVWTRHIDGSDKYDHSITDEQAVETLDEFYSGIGNRNRQDQVYLGILLFERAFEFPDQQAALFERARRIFMFYRKVTGETDWAAVEDRLEDIAMYYKDEGIEIEEVDSGKAAEAQAEAEAEAEREPTPSVTATAVAEPPEPEPEPPVESMAETVTTMSEIEAAADAARAEAAAEAEAVLAAAEAERIASEPPETEDEAAAAAAAVAESEAEAEADAQAAKVAASQITSAAEEEERQKAEKEAARREAAEAFIADLEMVDGMVLVPAGVFKFGPDEKDVFLDTFYVDKLPITNRQYMKFVAETGYRLPRYAEDERLTAPDQPVVGVSLGDAQQYAKWAGKEIPSERQWEKAARGTDGRPYPWGNDPPGASDARFGLDAKLAAPVAVGASMRNVSPFGVLDSAGNVWEWTTSLFGKEGEYKVVRGGSYNDPAAMLRLDFRLEAHPKDKCEAIGFRCVKNVHHH